MSGPRELSFLIDGRIIVIERFEDETDACFSERSSFILFFRNDPKLLPFAKVLSFHHANKIFLGVTYAAQIEQNIQVLRDRILAIKQQEAQ